MDAAMYEVEPLGSDAYKRGERCRSQALHQPWPTELLASNPLARLRKPPLPGPRCGRSGHKTMRGVDMKSRRHGRPSESSRCSCKMASANKRYCRKRARVRCTNRRLRRCHQKAGTTSRHHRERANTNAARCHKATRTRANTSPVGHCAKTFCPLGKNQALRIQEGQPESKSLA